MGLGVNWGSQNSKYQVLSKFQLSGVGNWGGQKSKCQVLSKFQFSDWGKQTLLMLLLYRHQKISTTGASTCFTDSLLHTTYVETNENTELIKYLTSVKCPLVRVEINIQCHFRETRTWATLILLLLLLMHSCHQDYGQFIQNTPKTCIYFNIDSTLLWCVTSKTALKISNFSYIWTLMTCSKQQCF